MKVVGLGGRSRPRLFAAAVVLVPCLVVTGAGCTSFRPASLPCHAGVGGQRYGLDAEQAVNASTIAAVARTLGLPDHAVTVALAAALQESKLHNVDYGDTDSVGLFQQRPSSGWGTVKDLMTPAYAAKQFYEALVSIQGWQSMALTYAIQAVQVSAYPDAYAPHEWAAQTVVDALTG